MTNPEIYTMSFAKVYPLYIAKVERKGRTKFEVDTIICWLTGYSPDELHKQLNKQIDVETFFAEAPELHPSKLIDELAKEKKMEKILRDSS
ncbi:DUF2200 family protein [Bacillus altitudinis]|uniref:DUF2200 family protein n=1 Tax=Bacillus altitudinis TaxID=293387 RepID=UPI00240653BA|nr:DUF2200 family protein [Bacillus altitudinis]MDF9417435.1 DUF2200 family protein [Bacillus altitudinis]